MTEPLDPLLVWIALAGLAALLAQAALAKLADRALFEQHLAAYGVPDRLLTVTAVALPAAEALAAGLLLTPLRSSGAALAAALLLVYAAVMAWHRSRGHVLDCGCGGDPLPLSWVLVLRNLGLVALASLAAAPMAARALGWGDFLVIAAAVVLGSLMYAALHQLLRHRAGIRLRASLRRS